MLKREEPIAESDCKEGRVHKMMTSIRKTVSPDRNDIATGSGGAPRSVALNTRPVFITMTLLAAIAVGMMLLLPGSSLHAQTPTFEFPENSEDAVATFTATDPEGATPIAWDIVEGAGDPDGVDGDLTNADNADAASFEIDKDGMLKFSSPPDFENPPTTNATANTYKVVVVACDVALDNNACPDTGKAGYHAVTVKVTNMDEPGTVSLATSTVNGTPQYLVGAILTATAEDGDITNETQTFTTDREGEVNGVTWRWYTGSTEITGADADDNTYTLLQADVGRHIRAVVFYVVDGNVDQEMAELTTDYPVLAVRIGDKQLEFDPAAVSRTISEGAKDRNVGAPVTATGNHGTIRYSLDPSGDANSGSPKFEIDEKSGQISTTVKLDYEAGANAENNCVSQNNCTVTVIATDSTGESTTGTGTDPNLRATVTIKITDVDETPAFSAGAEIVSVPENSTALFGAEGDGYSVENASGVTYTAADPEGRTVNYSLAGPDASKFQLSSDPPILSFVSGPDFEAKASADRDNVYEVTVRASVGSDTGERMVRVTVSNVDEGPEVSGPSTRNFAENGEGAVATFTATDPEGATPITWGIAVAETDHDGDDGPLLVADAADAAHFDIDDETGVLTFDIGGDDDTGDASVSPDFENPKGAALSDDTAHAAQNTYKVVVSASDKATDGVMNYHAVTVMVTSVDEPGKVTLGTSTSNGTPQYLVGAILTATASDGDITNTLQDFTVDIADEVTGVTWRWYRGGAEITDARAGQHLHPRAGRCKQSHPIGGDIPG